MSNDGPSEDNHIEDEINSEEQEKATDKAATSNSSLGVNIDNRSGGVHFDGDKQACIEGDVIGGAQSKTTHESHFHGTVTGPVHTGSGDIHVGSMSVGPNASLETLVTTLRRAVVHYVPPSARSKPLQRVNILVEAIAKNEPDIETIDAVLGWFQRHHPPLAHMVVTFILHPAVVEIIEASSDSVVREFKRRFGALNKDSGFTDGH